MNMFFPLAFWGVCVCCESDMEPGELLYCVDCIAAACWLDGTVRAYSSFYQGDIDMFDLSEMCQ